MGDIIKGLTSAWAMTYVKAFDILIKATIRAGHIMTNCPHLKHREHNFLTWRLIGWQIQVCSGLQEQHRKRSGKIEKDTVSQQMTQVESKMSPVLLADSISGSIISNNVTVLARRATACFQISWGSKNSRVFHVSRGHHCFQLNFIGL